MADPAPPAAVSRTTVAGHPAWALRAQRTRFVVVPDLGLLGTSLRHGRHEYLDVGAGPDRVLEGHTCGLPLLAPWANRLGGDDYRVGRRRVDLGGAPGLHREEHGLPIHGTMVGRAGWVVENAGVRRDAARLVAVFDAGVDDEVMASFPFPHRLWVTYRLSPGQLAVTTTITATGRSRVPVSFGWHPYFRLPGEELADLRLRIPGVDRLALDDRKVPTGASTRERGSNQPLDPAGYDDAFRFAGSPRSFALVGRRRSLRISMGNGYPYGQVYAPAGSPVVALEPMTAPTDALGAGTAASVAPGESFSARFRLTLT